MKADLCVLLDFMDINITGAYQSRVCTADSIDVGPLLLRPGLLAVEEVCIKELISWPSKAK